MGGAGLGHKGNVLQFTCPIFPKSTDNRLIVILFLLFPLKKTRGAASYGNKGVEHYIRIYAKE